MKKRILTTLLAACLCLGAASAAQSYKKSIEVEYGIGLTINGTSAVLKDPNGNTVQPFTYNGTTYVPIRAVSDHLGASVGYDAKNNTASINGKTSSVPNNSIVIPAEFFSILNNTKSIEDIAESILSTQDSLLLVAKDPTNYQARSLLSSVSQNISQLRNNVQAQETLINRLGSAYDTPKKDMRGNLTLLNDCINFLDVMYNSASDLVSNPYDTQANNKFLTAFSACMDSALLVKNDAFNDYNTWSNIIMNFDYQKDS